MGKRRGSKKKQSKTSKSKQSKTSKTFVSLNVHTPSSTTGTKNGMKLKASKEQRRKKDSTMTWFVGPDQLKQRQNQAQNQKLHKETKDKEQAEFEREHASLQERHRQEMYKKQSTKQQMGRKKKNAPVLHEISLTPPTFTTEKAPATTQELVNDTVNQLSSWTDFGSEQQQTYRLSTLSQYLTKPITTNTSSTESNSKGDPNSFSAFQESDDDDDNSVSNCTKTISVPFLQFAPPSFHVGNNDTNNHLQTLTTKNNNDYDPDL